MEIESFEIEYTIIEIDILESTLPVTIIYNFLHKDENFTGNHELNKQGPVKYVTYKDAVIIIDEKPFELSQLTFSQDHMGIVIKNASSIDSKKISKYIWKAIPKEMNKKIKKEENLHSIARVKTSFKLSSALKTEYVEKLEKISKLFPNFEDTEKEVHVPGIHFRIVPTIKGEYATKVAKGLLPVQSYEFNMDYRNSKDYENNVITIMAGVEDTKLKEILKSF